MRFGPVPPGEAAGAILAHSLSLPGGRLRKGRVLGAAEVAALEAAGLGEVTVARLEPGDVGEDEAAAKLAAALLEGSFGVVAGAAATGRVNIHADGPGILHLDAARIRALNAVDPAITFASLVPFARLGPRVMAGTVKIIPYAVPEAALARACDAARGAIRRIPPALADAALIVTEVPGAPEDPGGRGARAVAGRLEGLGVALAGVRVAAHEAGALAAALGEAPGAAVLILTASATSDIRDVGPAAVALAGGRVTRFGMPVDPGNLLFLGEIGGRPVIGLPGCARSPALNGADWVMERVLCGVPVAGEDIAAMGVGGLLKESPARGRPREARGGFGPATD